MAESKSIKAMVVDDAAFMRKQLVEILSSSDEIDVVGVARHGKEALEAIEELKPDVITLDVDMPVMDGITTIKHIMIRYPVPVVMVSGLADQSKITFEALRLGAIDFFPKPSGTISKDIGDKASELIETLKVAARANLKAIKRAYFKRTKSLAPGFTMKKLQGAVLLFAGQGSISASIRLMDNLADLKNLAILCIQDLSPGIINSFGKELGKIVECDIYNGQELNITPGRLVLLSNYLLPQLSIHKDKVILKDNNGKGLDEFLASLSSCFDNHSTLLAILGGKAPSSLKPFKGFSERSGKVVYVSPEYSACNEIIIRLRKEGIGEEVKNEIELINKIRAHSRKLILEQVAKN